MTPKEAYCCLNCAASANCCGSCGECPGCCADCGDTSICQRSAYFYNDSFYKHFLMTAQKFDDTLYFRYDGNFLNQGYYSSSYDTRIDPPCCLQGWGKGRNDRAYFYKQDAQYNCEKTTTTVSYEDCEDCPRTSTSPSQCYLGPALYTSDSPVAATECFPEFPDFEAKSGTVACKSPEVCDALVCAIDYPGSCQGPVCIPFTFPCDESNQKERRYLSRFISQIEFFNPLYLYNNEGQNVGNIINATYNPCSPTTSWSAPGCHFFHP